MFSCCPCCPSAASSAPPAKSLSCGTAFKLPPRFSMPPMALVWPAAARAPAASEANAAMEPLLLRAAAAALSTIAATGPAEALCLDTKRASDPPASPWSCGTAESDPPRFSLAPLLLVWPAFAKEPAAAAASPSCATEYRDPMLLRAALAALSMTPATGPTASRACWRTLPSLYRAPLMDWALCPPDCWGAAGEAARLPNLFSRLNSSDLVRSWPPLER
mmetsp:Transcript_33349/g.78135  ORF Transcript_33349/g.78135 Transcript_33349/m.78135 type:complete len:219 (-) Transcript_33349:74-730(-)